MNPLVIVRRPHTRTRYTGDPDALPYRGWYSHAPRPWLRGIEALDTLGRHNGLTHTWLAYECANVGCRYLLLVRAGHAHDLAVRDYRGPRTGLATASLFRGAVEGALTSGAFVGDAPPRLSVRLYEPRLNFIPNDSTGSTR